MYIQLTFGDLVLTPTITNSVLIIASLTIFFIICGMTIKRADPTRPSKGFMAFIEFIYSAICDFAANSIGEQGHRFIPFVVTVASYLALANMAGLLGLRPPTSDINITVALAIITLTYIMLSGIFSKGLWRYLKDTYIGDIRGLLLVLFIPISIIGEFSKIVSLSFRLFGNVVSGALLISLLIGALVWGFTMWPVGGMLSSVFNIGLLPVVSAYFDIFAGLMQTFIFCTLTTMWIKSAVESEA